MNKEEFAIGERFQCGLVTLKVVEALDDYDCAGCFFESMCTQGVNLFLGKCAASSRTDNKNVIFKQVKYCIMDRQEEYSKVRNESVVRLIHELCLDNTNAHQVVFNDLFKEAYNLGKKHAREGVANNVSDDVRLQVATAAMQGILSNEKQVRFACEQVRAEEVPLSVSEYAVACADALIAEVSKKGGEE